MVLLMGLSTLLRQQDGVHSTTHFQSSLNLPFAIFLVAFAYNQPRGLNIGPTIVDKHLNLCMNILYCLDEYDAVLTAVQPNRKVSRIHGIGVVDVLTIAFVHPRINSDVASVYGQILFFFQANGGMSIDLPFRIGMYQAGSTVLCDQGTRRYATLREESMAVDSFTDVDMR